MAEKKYDWVIVDDARKNLGEGGDIMELQMVKASLMVKLGVNLWIMEKSNWEEAIKNRRNGHESY